MAGEVWNMVESDYEVKQTELLAKYVELLQKILECLESLPKQIAEELRKAKQR